MINKKQISYLILGFVFVLALLFRLYRLNYDNPALYADEVGGQYWYFSWVHNPEIAWPLQIFRGIVSSPTSLAWIFGFSPLISRLPAAINGSLLVIIFYFFATNLSQFSNKKELIGLVGALLISLLPWSFGISRLYGNIPFILILILIHLIFVLRTNNLTSKVLSLIPLCLSVYYYPSMIIIVPIILFFVGLRAWPNLSVSQKKILSPILVILIICFGFFVQSRFGVFSSKSRGLDLAIWRDVNVTANSNLYRGLARLSSPTIFSFGQDSEKIANKIVFNYPLSVLSVFAKNYLSFFSPDFLFLKGDQVLRHSTSIVGNFYLILLPFMVFGAFKFYALRTKHSLLITLWLLASPLPAAITKDGATYLLRVITMMPILTYFCALGLVEAYEFQKTFFRKTLYTSIVGGILLFSSYYYFFGYFHVYPALSADSFEYGFKELANFQTANPGKMLIVWDDKYPYNHFCFWQNLPYSVCKTENTNTRVTVGVSRVDLALPEVIFSLPSSINDLIAIIGRYHPSYLIIPNKYNKKFSTLLENYKIIKIINNPDTSIAFEIYEI